MTQHSRTFVFNTLLAFLLLAASCKSGNDKQSTGSIKQKIGVLLVNHGSRSETWRNALLALETRVKDSILSKGIQGAKTAFMEYNEPSIATRLKEFDDSGYTDIIIVPVFLTVSPHSFDDIPTIIGQKEDLQSMEALKMENIVRYTPKAKTHITPLLDFTDILQKNILRRVKDISKNPAEEGLVLMAYGDQTYMKEWTALLDKVGTYVQTNMGITEHANGWCGHVANYRPDSTTVAIQRVLKNKKTAVVIPVLVAHDEMFQIKIIGDGISKVQNSKDRVIYKPDSILPDTNVEAWIINIVASYKDKIQEGTASK